MIPVHSKGRECLLYSKSNIKPVSIPFRINTNDNDVMNFVNGMNDARIFSATNKYIKQFLKRNISISRDILAKQMI